MSWNIRKFGKKNSFSFLGGTNEKNETKLKVKVYKKGARRKKNYKAAAKHNLKMR